MANFGELSPSFPHQRAQMGFAHPPAMAQPAVQPNQLRKMQTVKLKGDYWGDMMRNYWRQYG